MVCPIVVGKKPDTDKLAVALGDWEAAYEQAVAFVAGLTNDEKLSIATGSDVTSANWTALEFKDGSQGVQGYDYVTGFPESSALVMTWDRDLIETQFRAVASEFYGKGKFQRSPLRNLDNGSNSFKAFKSPMHPLRSHLVERHGAADSLRLSAKTLT